MSNSSSKKPTLRVIDGGAGDVEKVEIPERVEFSCPRCKASCLMFPRAKPIAVQHAIPTCVEWQRVERKREDLERFLIKAGAHLLIPVGKG